MQDKDIITSIRQMVSERKPVPDMCVLLGISRSSLYRFVRMHGLRLYNRTIDNPTAIPSLISEGLSQREVMAKLGIGRGSVKYWLKKLGMTTLHHRTCALFECQKQFLASHPDAECCCYEHKNRQLKLDILIVFGYL